MTKEMKKYETVDEYIQNYPEDIQKVLQKVRQTIQKEAPEAVEAISYGIPTFKLNGNLVHFGGYEHHIGFYPGSEAIEVFAKELTKYDSSKGTIRFPMSEPIPFDLIAKITAYRVKKNSEKKK